MDTCKMCLVTSCVFQVIGTLMLLLEIAWRKLFSKEEYLTTTIFNDYDLMLVSVLTSVLAILCVYAVYNEYRTNRRVTQFIGWPFVSLTTEFISCLLISARVIPLVCSPLFGFGCLKDMDTVTQVLLVLQWGFCVVSTFLLSGHVICGYLPLDDKQIAGLKRSQTVIRTNIFKSECGVNLKNSKLSFCLKPDTVEDEKLLLA